ncbi:MAG: hypothetical protein M1434_10440 [Chloroflexi bacterium]|nr:hypothetical protein [Chloroflexota bacterium]MCL5275144.1 hypothetical protein [Chloroflexota bacterium]
MKTKLSRYIILAVATVMLVLGTIFATPLPAAAGCGGCGGGSGGIFSTTTLQ